MAHITLNTLKYIKLSIWQSSFDACNLNPEARVSFPEWYNKIESFLQKREIFKVEISDNKYLLLPGYWYGMLLNDKKRIFSLIEESSEFTPDYI